MVARGAPFGEPCRPALRAERVCGTGRGCAASVPGMDEKPAPDPHEVTDATAADGVTAADAVADDGGGDRAESAVGCLLAVAGVTGAAIYAFPRAAFSIDGGFEGHARDLSVAFVDVPLILLAGLLLPPMTWAAATRWLRPWAALPVCLAVAALALWGIDAVWHPRQLPDPGYRGGI